MRKIDLKEPDTKPWRKWRAACAAERARAEADVAAGRKPAISDMYKKQKQWFRNPDGAFEGKCAYCETRITHNQHGHIEHYRPKAAITELDWTPVERKVGGRTEPHPGYYWLAYEWENLLLACCLCNGTSEGRAYGKLDRFPIAGMRAWAPEAENAEDPLLLNPSTDDPADHLRFDSRTGMLEPITERGRVTIEVLGLNCRGLPEARFEIAADVKARVERVLIELALVGVDESKRRLRALREDKKRDFTSVVREAYRSVMEPLRQVVKDA